MTSDNSARPRQGSVPPSNYSSFRQEFRQFISDLAWGLSTLAYGSKREHPIPIRTRATPPLPECSGCRGCCCKRVLDMAGETYPGDWGA